MTKKIMAVVLVLLMLVLGGVRLKADHCGEERIVSRDVWCDGNSCMKWGTSSPYYKEKVVYGSDCWDSRGEYYFKRTDTQYNNRGCC